LPVLFFRPFNQIRMARRNVLLTSCPRKSSVCPLLSLPSLYPPPFLYPLSSSTSRNWLVHDPPLLFPGSSSDAYLASGLFYCAFVKARASLSPDPFWVVPPDHFDHCRNPALLELRLTAIVCVCVPYFFFQRKMRAGSELVAL